MKIPILYEDESIIVCVKPQGVSSQADKSNDEDIVNYFKSYIYDREELDEEPYLAVIHRLDRPVGGIVIFAKTKYKTLIFSA